MITWMYYQGLPDSVFGDFNIALHGSIYGPATETELPLVGPPRELVFTGDFDVTGGEATAGIVTGFKLYKAGVLVLAASGYAIDVLALIDAIAGFNSDDKATLQSLLYSKPMTVNGSAENDAPLPGGEAADIIHGGAGDDLIYDGGETDDDADALFGGGGNDALIAYLGNDLLDGGAGADEMVGGAGNDTYVVDNAGDKVIELADDGVDTVRSFIDYTLPDNVEHLDLVGDAAISGTGNALANVITGNKAANRIDGAAGDDVLSGGRGKDKVIGGAGADQFVFNVEAKKKDADKISDFNAGEDLIVLDNAAFKALKGKVLKGGDYFHVGKKAAGKKDFVMYDENSGKLAYDGDGKGGSKAKLIAKLDSGLDLSAADILVV
jgi:Ca2+-binding RTX toxin-like protein